MRCGSVAGKASGTLSVRSSSPDDTVEMGRIIGRTLCAGDVVALVGELGAGKTCLTQGIARGLDVSTGYAVTSPTFTLINEYPGRLTLFHMDMYRLAGAGETMDMGLIEYFDGSGVTVIEWAEKIEDILPERALSVSIAYVSEEVRNVIFSGSEERLAVIATALNEGGFNGWR